jgi:hypothetical protein
MEVIEPQNISVAALRTTEGPTVASRVTVEDPGGQQSIASSSR